jgi:hypothetical protein
MARIRQIKPGFFLDDELALCCRDTRLLFVGLWVIADRAGRLQDRPPRIKAQVFPYDQDINIGEIEHCLDELTDGGFIERYMTDDGKRLIEIRNFSKHQHFHAKEPASELPAPEQVRTKHRTTPVPASDKTDVSTVQEPDKTDSSRLGIGYLESGIGDRVVGVGIGDRTKPPVSKSTPPHTPASAFFLTDELRSWAEAAASDIDPEAETEKFRDYYGRNGKTFADLPAAWRKWIRDAVDRQNQARAPAGRRESRGERNERICREIETEDAERARSAKHGKSP